MKRLDDIEYIEYCGLQESQDVHEKKYFEETGIDIIKNGLRQFGDPLPWVKTHQNIRFRPNEITIWGGWNGHGKSYITGQVALWLTRNTKVLMASLEMTPAITLIRQATQAAGCDQISTEFYSKFVNWHSENCLIYDQVDTVDPEVILGVINYHAKNDNIKHFFIDSLTKCGIREDDYTAQTNFVDKLTYYAKAHNAHIHLVHHLKKDESENKKPNKFHLKGSGGITDLADNVITVWRNKVKEAKIENGADPSEHSDCPDTVMTVEKQRNGQWEGPINLWLHRASMQFMPKPSRSPMLFELD